MIDEKRYDLNLLPCDTEPQHACAGSQGYELPAPPVSAAWRDSTEAPAVANVGHLPRRLYTINSDRPRHEIIATYAREHNLTVKQIDALVRALPDYGLRTQLHASLAAVTRTAEVISMAAARRARGQG